MSALLLIKAAGFLFGSSLHLFLLVIFLRRRNWDRLKQLLFCLVCATTLWHVGNLGAMVISQIPRLAFGRFNQFFDALAYLGLASLPPLLLNTHLVVYRKKGILPQIPAAFAAILYVPLLALPWSLSLLFRFEPQDPIGRSGPFAVPFVLWFTVALVLSGWLDGRIAAHVAAEERRLYNVLRVYFWTTAATLVYVYVLGGRRLWLGSWFEAAVMLSSILPVAMLAYYIYRYRYLEIIVQKSIAYALIVLAVLIGYLAGVRQIGAWAQSVTGLPAILIESAMMLGLVFLFPALASWIDRQVGHLFKTELKRYSETAERIRQGAHTILSPALLVEFIEVLLRRDLHLKNLHIRLFEPGQEVFVPPRSGLWRVYPLQAGAVPLGSLELELTSGEQMATLDDALPLLAGEITTGLERSRLLQNQLRLERELVQKSHLASLGQMAATIAHNVKNPLSSMKTLLQVLCEDPALQPAHRHELEMVLQEINRLAQTVTSLLRFSRPGESPARETIDIGEFFASLIRFFAPQAKARGVEVNLRFDQSVQVLADREQWLDIFSNLLINAIEASEEGGRVQIDVRGDRRDFPQRLHVDVCDHGSGIPEALGPRIFDPFVTNKQRGTGLGLAIVRRRLEQMGGTIFFESPWAEGRGTRFRIEFPIHEVVDESA